MLWFLNKFHVIVKEKNKYIFIEVQEKGYEYSFSTKQQEIFDKLLAGEGIEESELEEQFEKNILQQWKDKKILIMSSIDDSNQYSRTESYFWHMNMENSMNILKRSKILVLGCGGIGSHVAWNMTALGIEQIVLVDYDIVEISNLNRQLLYDRNDLGKHKVEVLKKKLQCINPNISIEAISRRINSPEELRNIIIQYQPDCIVKSLDSPIYFGEWLDEVCKETHTKYVSGIMTGTKQALGPTYIPGESASYTDIFKVPITQERIAGIGPSLSFVVYQIAGELSEEIVKVLLKLPNLSFKDKAVLRNNLLDEKEIVYRPDRKKPIGVINTSIINLINILIIVFLSYIRMCFTVPTKVFLPLLILFALLAPVFEAISERQAYKYAFINLISFFICNIFSLLATRSMVGMGAISIMALILFQFTLISIILLVVCVLEIGMIHIKNYIFSKVVNWE